MRSILILAFALAFVTELLACDICHIYLNLRPNDFSHRIGLQYRNRILIGNIPNPGFAIAQPKHLDDERLVSQSGESYTEIHEYYQVLELQADYQISYRWLVRGSLPYLDTQTFVANEPGVRVNAIGDPWVMVQHRLYNSVKKEELSAFNHRLNVGLGLKFPLGSTTLRHNDESIAYDMQPGSGSYDALASLEYMLRWKSLGFSVSGVYKINGENLSAYRFGNTLQSNAVMFAVLKEKNWYWMPSGGTYYEQAGKDRMKKETLRNTGGDVLFLGLGLEAGTERIALRMGVQKSVHDHLENSTVPSRWRYTCGLQYLINTN